MKFSPYIGLVLLILVGVIIAWPKDGGADKSLVSGISAEEKIQSSRQTSIGDRKIPRSGRNFQDVSLEESSKRKPIQLSRDGSLPSGAAELLSVSDEDFALIQRRLTVFRDKILSELKERLVYDDSLSNVDGDNSEVYRLSAIPSDVRESIMDEVFQDLSGLAGEDAAKSIVAGLDSSESFAYMGKYDAKFRMKPMTVTKIDPKTFKPLSDPEILPGQKSIEFSYTDPISGATRVRGGTDLKRLNSKFGNLFKQE